MAAAFSRPKRTALEEGNNADDVWRRILDSASRLNPHSRLLEGRWVHTIAAVLPHVNASIPARIINPPKPVQPTSARRNAVGRVETHVAALSGVSGESGIGSPVTQYPSPTLTNSGELHMTFAIRFIGTLASISMPARTNRSRISDRVNG